MLKCNKKVVMICILAAIIMFAFCFAMVPLYRLVCKATGLNAGVNATEVRDTNQATGTRIKRPILVQFVVTNNAELPWEFYPETSSITVDPEQTVQVMFHAKNNSGHRMVVQAIPSFAPPEAAQYFHKVDCFCFRAQVLDGEAQKNMPVVFHIDKDLPQNIRTITLSYTLFDITGKVNANEIKQ